MRRRTWALIRLSDVIFSHQVSLPSMIYGHDCDTQLPHNLFDEEFGPDTKVLPPSRPNAEPTPISYMISKVKLCLELGSILQATGRVRDHVPRRDPTFRREAARDQGRAASTLKTSAAGGYP